MFLKRLKFAFATTVAFSTTLVAFSATASEDVPIEGTVEAKCVITTDTTGVYGNPVPYKLSTASTDGGVLPIIRYDVISADYFKASIDHPNSFSSSPTLDDTVSWAGSTSVHEVSDSNMSGYDSNKVEFNNTTEFDLTVAGTTWFKVSSTAEYGYQKAFPAGDYTALVSAECIAL